MTEKISKPGLYVHIPFCDRICSYCAFAKVFYREDLADRYLNRLEKELHKYDGCSFRSVYIGGGTPSSLTPAQLERLFSILSFYAEEQARWTVEINPEIEEEKIRIFSLHGVARVSMGVQTFQKRLLSIIGREHSFDQVKERVDLLHRYDIKDINVDLMYGLPDESEEELKRDLSLLLSLDVTHVSAYCLQVEEKTVLFNRGCREEDPDVARRQYEMIVDTLKDHGLFRYEVSNFSKPGFESEHNLIYWNNEEYGGVGLNASAYIDHIRRTNTKSLTEYLKGNFGDYEEILTEEDEEFYFLMLGFRKEEGISLREFEQRFHKNFLASYGDKIADADGFEISEGRCRLKEENIYILDFFLRKILF